MPVNAVTVLVAGAATALATGLGALPLTAARGGARSWLGVADALAAGCMVGASVGLALEGRQRDTGATLLGIVTGLAFIAATRPLVERSSLAHLGSLRGADARRAILVVGVMTIHSFSEGVGVGVAFGESEQLGVLIAVAIAVHNIPEGLAISLVLVPRGASVASAAGWSVFSSVPQALMAVPAYLFVESFAGVLPVGLGFAAGAMLWLVVADLLPEAVETTRLRTVALTGAGAALAMIVFQLVLL